MAENLILHPFFTNVVLPFIFSFVLIYALLEKIKLLGDNKQAHLLISLAMSFFFVGVPIYLDITWKIIPAVVIGVIALFCLMLLFGIMGIEFYSGGKGYNALRGWLSAILVIIVLAAIIATTNLPQKLLPLLKPEFIQLFLFLAVTAIVVWVVVAAKPSGGGKT